MVEKDTKKAADTDVAELGEKVREQVEAHLAEARAATEKAQERIGAAAGRTADDTLHFVRSNPGIAMAGAVGFGVLVGLALRGRS